MLIPLIIMILQDWSQALSIYGERLNEKCKLDIFCRECIWDVSSSVSYLIDLYCNICDCILCVQLIHSNLVERMYLFVRHLIIVIIKLEVSTFPDCCHFSVVVSEIIHPKHLWLCVWGGSASRFFISRKLRFVSIITVQSIMCVDNRVQ